MKFFDRLKQIKEFEKAAEYKRAEIASLNNAIASQQVQLEKVRAETAEAEKIKQQAETEKQNAINNRDSELLNTKTKQEEIIKSYSEKIATVKEPYETLIAQHKALNDEYESLQRKIEQTEDTLKMQRRLINRINKEMFNNEKISPGTLSELCKISPEIELHLHSHDVKQLKGLISENEKLIKKALERNEKRYTTKTNRALYQLMVIALQAEMQNILTYLKFNTLQKCKEKLNNMIEKYLSIAIDGNQTIAPTIKSFISEMDELFEQKIDIEFEYYYKKEMERQEQLALREQMRQEEEERKALEAEKKKVEKEEEKYKLEIQNIENMILENPDAEKVKTLETKIKELQEALLHLTEKKEDIINRQNGKAGYVYVISNLGSFGDKTFKVGMTRRLDPMERVRELGDASVPFPFDVHSFIFSDDAVGLETELHKRLEPKRKNKVNPRKEFFDVSIEELEDLVQEINPAAEFNKTMVAIDYRKSIE